MNFEKYPIRCKLDKPAFNHARKITRQEFLKRKNLISYADRIDYLTTLLHFVTKVYTIEFFLYLTIKKNRQDLINII